MQHIKKSSYGLLYTHAIVSPIFHSFFSERNVTKKKAITNEILTFA
jgi:hypothetical protein